MTSLKRFGATLVLGTLLAACGSQESASPTKDDAREGAGSAYSLQAKPQPCGCQVTGSGEYTDTTFDVLVPFSIQMATGIRNGEQAGEYTTKATVTINHPVYGTLTYRLNYLNCAIGIEDAFISQFKGANEEVEVQIADRQSGIDHFAVIDRKRSITTGGDVTTGNITLNRAFSPPCN